MNKFTFNNLRLFNKSDEKAKEVDEEIVGMIMAQNDRLAILFKVLEKLPVDLVSWFTWRLREQQTTGNNVEVSIATEILSGVAIPGDLLVKTNRDPRVGDILEVVLRNDDGYYDATVKVIKINVKEGNISVEALFNSLNRGTIAPGNILYALDKVIEYGNTEWKNLVRQLNLVYDVQEIASDVKRSISVIEKSANFHDKEKNLKKLNERLKILKSLS